MNAKVSNPVLDEPQFTCEVPDSARKNPNAPFVMLCGWFQAKDEHLRMYSNALQKLGCGTLRGTYYGGAPVG